VEFIKYGCTKQSETVIEKTAKIELGIKKRRKSKSLRFIFLP